MAAPKIVLSQRQLIIIGAVLLLTIAVVVLVRANLREQQNIQAVTLTVWGTEPRRAFDTLFRSYTESLRTNVTIRYEQIDTEEYESSLLRAFAAGEGPDVFMIGNRDLPKQKDLLSPAPISRFSLSQFRTSFPTIAEQDFTDEEAIYALPLYVDTLALVYNKNLFDQAGIATLPATWSEFIDLIPRIRTLNAQGQIIRAAAGIGESQATVERATDILHLLMLQNGTEMVNEHRSAAAFASGEAGLKAFQFYLQFANAGSASYTWNDTRPRSFEGFVNGNTGMVFAYLGDTHSFKKQNPFLEFGIISMPQVSPERKVAYGKYEGFAVSKQSAYPEWGWDFVIYAATEPVAIATYLAETERPPALRSLIEKNFSDETIGTFATQALTARSWYITDEEEVNRIFNETIKNVLTGKLDAKKSLEQAEDQVSELMR